MASNKNLFILLFCPILVFAQVTPNAQWHIPVGQWLVGNSDLDCVQAANTYTMGPFLNLVLALKSMSCPGAPPNYGPSNQTYTSGVVIANTFNFQYGVVKVRAQMPGLGVHGGIYMGDARCQAFTVAGGFGATNCPAAVHTEIDIVDYLPGLDGSAKFRCTYFNSAGSQAFGQTVSVDPTTFHVYTFAWTASGMTWSVDGTSVCTTALDPAVPMFPLIGAEANTTVGGTAPGGYPITILVDYYRVCSSSTAVCNPGDPTMIFDDEFTGNDGITHGQAAIRGQVTSH